MSAESEPGFDPGSSQRLRAPHYRFADPAVEREYQEHTFRAFLGVVRFGILLALALYALFGFLDRYMLAESTRHAVWLIRFAVVVPLLALTLAATFQPSYQRWHDTLLFAVSLVLAGGILAMIYLSHPSDPGYRHYYAGLMLVVMWTGTLSLLPVRLAEATIGATILGYVGVAVLHHGMADGGFSNPDLPVLINNLFFLVGSAILAVFSAHSFESARRRQFLQTRQISAERAKTEMLLRQIETLLGQQVSSEVARELASGSGQLESRLCTVTVMFLDIRDFTSFADSRDPEEVASFQNTVFGALIDIIRTHRGVISQILGDGIMATFGAPVEIETHARDAVAAGYAIIDRIDRLGDAGAIPRIRVGIGLHSGTVLAGNIGNEFRKQYSLTGSKVIIAARIEQLNKEHGSQFLVSRTVMDRVPELAEDATSLGPTALKGIGRPVELFQLI